MSALRFVSLLVLISTSAFSQTAASSGFALGSINLGYMSENEFAERVSISEITGYIDRVKAACVQVYADDRVPKQFDIVVIVHSGHSHIWFVGAEAGDGRTFEQLSKKLSMVDLPALRKGPIVFAIDARIAGGRPGGVERTGAPPIPEEWKKALAGAKSATPLHIDDVVKLVCPR